MGLDAVVLVVVLLLLASVVLPVVALVRTRKIRKLEDRLAGVEAALRRLFDQQQPASEVRALTPPAPAAPPARAVQTAAAPAPPLLPPAPDHLETVIGRKWLGAIAIVLIVCAAVFFLKYAFENRWIGELGRVSLGVAAALALVWAGYGRHRRGWRYLAQVLNGGGIFVLYLSIYGAFAYYHLIDQRSAFVFLAVVVAEAHLLALSYRARPIAIMALVGGFLVPLLLSTGRDNYRVLFTYIGLLDAGMLGVVIARRWRGLGSLAYVGTQVLFWGWYSQHYHPEKRPAVLVFQAAVFALFVMADLAPQLRRQPAGWEEWIRLVVNPFVFYATCYGLLNDDHHEWMAVLALLLAIVYAALARVVLWLGPSDRRMLLVTLGTALTFVTVAIPVQLESNWITIAWGVEGLALLWAGFQTAAAPLRRMSAVVFGAACFRFLFLDTQWDYRPLFTPLLNRYFLGMLALAACLGAAAYLYRLFGPAGGRAALGLALLAFGVFWLGSSFEAYSYFDARAGAVLRAAQPDAFDEARQLRWAGQLSLSLLWSAYAGLLTACGFRLRTRALRVAGLALFGITLVKAVLLDMSELRQFYRIVAVLALGLVLLAVAWAYQRGLRREQTQ